MHKLPKPKEPEVVKPVTNKSVVELAKIEQENKQDIVQE